MYCTNCANQLPEQAKFCNVCGAKTASQLRAETPPETVTAPAPSLPVQEVPAVSPVVPPQTEAAAPPAPFPAVTPPPFTAPPQMQNAPIAAPPPPPPVMPPSPPAPPMAVPFVEPPQPPTIPDLLPGTPDIAPINDRKRGGKVLPVLAAVAIIGAATAGAWRFGLLDSLPFLSSDAQQDIPDWAAVADAGTAVAPVFAEIDVDDATASSAATPEREEPEPRGDSREDALRAEEEAKRAAEEAEEAEESHYTEEEMYDLMERGLLTEEQQKNFEMEMAKRAEMEAAGLKSSGGNVQSWGGVSITVLASSAMEGTDYSYAVSNVMDNDPSTAWIEDSNGQGIGEWIMIMTSNTTPARLSHLSVQNGYQKSTKTFTENSRVKDIVIDFSDGLQMEHTLQDITGWQDIPLPPDLETSYIKITILTVYPGSLYEFTGLSGVECW